MARAFEVQRYTVLRARRRAEVINPNLPRRKRSPMRRAPSQAQLDSLGGAGNLRSVLDLSPEAPAPSLPPEASALPEDTEAEEKFLHSLVWNERLPTAERRAALQDLERYRAARKALGQTLGPKPPVTISEVIRRLADQLEGVGKELARRAWREAFYARPLVGVRVPSCESQEPTTESPPISAATISENDPPEMPAAELDSPAAELNGSEPLSENSDQSSESAATPSPLDSSSSLTTSDATRENTTAGPELEVSSPSLDACEVAVEPSLCLRTSLSTPLMQTIMEPRFVHVASQSDSATDPIAETIISTPGSETTSPESSSASDPTLNNGAPNV